jgi:general secretion pathway protein D
VRANSLLVFASTNDMTTITNIISKLDIVLAQVMIETIIMDVSLNHDWNLGVSAQQRQKAFDGRSATNSRALGVGGFNNGQSFFDFLGSTASNLPAGSSYFGQVGIGPTFDIALQAAATDSRINVIQKPRIMTSHAKKGSIFLGETRPTVSSTYYGGGFGGSPSSSYQQLEVGIRLDITPYINTDGLVVMEIQQEINEISGVTILTGVGEVPNTTKRSLEAEVAVKNGETIMLGGFIRDSSSGSKSGVPLLKDIPLIGKLFSSSSTKKGRSELVVLMKPTVLRTPEEAAMHTDIEKARMPGVRAAEAELEKEESKKADASKKKTVFRDVSSKSQTQPAAIKAPAAAEVPR